jgi:transposase
MDQEAWIRAHVAALAFFGGAPLLLVVDNLKAGVLRPDLYDPAINRGYAELAAPGAVGRVAMAPGYAAPGGVIVDPCRVAKPKDKPRVERPMSYIQGGR